MRFEACKANASTVEVTLTVPKGILRSFCHLLGTLEELFKHISHKELLASMMAEAKRPEVIEKANKARAEFTHKVLEHFDRLTASGMDAKEAIRHTNRLLKAEEHPWACYDLVLAEIRRAGRLKGKGVYRSRKASGKGRDR